MILIHWKCFPVKLRTDVWIWVTVGWQIWAIFIATYGIIMTQYVNAENIVSMNINNNIKLI